MSTPREQLHKVEHMFEDTLIAASQLRNEDGFVFQTGTELEVTKHVQQYCADLLKCIEHGKLGPGLRIRSDL